MPDISKYALDQLHLAYDNRYSAMLALLRCYYPWTELAESDSLGCHLLPGIALNFFHGTFRVKFDC
jgi:hypothetical protein